MPSEDFKPTEKELDEWAKDNLAKGDDLLTDSYPYLSNFSSAFIYQFVPTATSASSPEFIYLKTDHLMLRNHSNLKFNLAIAQWNLAWEAGQYRYKYFGDKLPKKIKNIPGIRTQNIYLLPITSFHRYEAYSPLFHLLPQRTLNQYGLPLIKAGLWPFVISGALLDRIMPKDFNVRLSNAIASHIWPFLGQNSGISAFRPGESINILAHNLNYWLPYIYKVAEGRIKAGARVSFEDKKQKAKCGELVKVIDNEGDDVHVNRPLMGGVLWMGEDEAKQATSEMIEYADSHGKLRAIIDAIRSNRVEDDFSDCWSFAKEDFERKLYKKRSKIKVNFVEMNETIPVHGPESEIHESLLWEDFIAMLNEKDKRIVVCLRSGITKVGDISRELGYANHSPVSRALSTIREKARKFLSDV